MSKTPPGPRTRSDMGQTPTYLRYVVTASSYLAGYPSSGTVATGGYSGPFKVMNDIVTPEFAKKIRAGVVINNPMGITSLVTTSPIIDCTTTNTGSPISLTRRYMGDGMGLILGPLVPATGTLNFGSYPDPIGTSASECELICSTQAWKGVNPNSALSLVTLAEAQKTQNLIFGKAQKLATLIHMWREKRPMNEAFAFLGMVPKKAPRPKRIPVWTPSGTVRTKHGKVRGVWAHEPVTPSSWNAMDASLRTWLEWRYGWNPLVKDIVDHMKALLKPEPWRERTRHTSRGYYSRTNSTLSVSAPYTKYGGIWTHQVMIEKSITGRGYILWELNPGNPFSVLNDFGLFDVPRTVLELVPYSFVAEWLVGFDAFLQAWQPKIGVNVLASGMSTVQTKTVRRTIKSYVRDGVYLGSWPSAPVPVGTEDGFVATSKTRSVPLSRPSRPIVHVELNAKRLTDAVALLKGAVVRGTTRY